MNNAIVSESFPYDEKWLQEKLDTNVPILDLSLEPNTIPSLSVISTSWPITSLVMFAIS
ncbi:hypothetical protein RGV85_24660 [Peribacillus simplex]|nr:hypothetical protein [Peribacillus simplex]MDR4929368.1 hypothetical protein [Peribacillus simplex]